MYFIYSISVQLYFNTISEHTHACFPAWHEFSNYVEGASLCLYSQLLTKSHFLFPITVEWRPPNSCCTGPNMMIQNIPETAAINLLSNVRTCVLPCGAQELHHMPYLFGPLKQYFLDRHCVIMRKR